MPSLGGVVSDFVTVTSTEKARQHNGEGNQQINYITKLGMCKIIFCKAQ